MKKNLLLSIVVLLLVVILSVSISSCVTRNVIQSINTTTTIRNQNNNIQSPDGIKETYDYSNTFLLIDALFKNYSIFDVDYETAMLAAIRAYVEATGDKYAMFYTPEELDAWLSDNNGDLYGVGVQVIFDYDEYFMEVIQIMPDSPAEACLQVGDKVTHITVNGEKLALVDLVAQYKEKAQSIYTDYTEEEINIIACNETFDYTIANLKGPEGTYAEFTIDRNGVSQDLVVQRAKVKTVSVTAKTSIRDSRVGIVTISQFDFTTPTQFKACMDSLISQGCDKFVFDLRNNPGGNVAAFIAVISTLLQKDDLILTEKSSDGTVIVNKVTTLDYSSSVSVSGSDVLACNVTEADIGKYSGYDFTVLINENSASAAEMFTSALRDHNLAQIVGVKSYGKGSIQSLVRLDNYGSQYYGGLKFTTKLYFPPCGEGFDGGIGIEPHYTVELEGIALETHFYKLTEEIDNQLQKAVSLLID